MKPILFAMIFGTIFLYGSEVESASSPRDNNVAEFVDEQFDILSPDSAEVGAFEVHSPGASFIKLHFSHFHIPHGMAVEVRNPDGTESYLYSNTIKGPRTFNPESGDDGHRSFSAMSISGDTAIVEIHGKTRGLNVLRHKISVDHFLKGNPTGDAWGSLSRAESYGTDSKDNSSIESINMDVSAAQGACGAYESFDAVCYAQSNPTEYDRSRPVAKILVGIKACTAWRVGADNRMFTNNHCMLSQAETSAAEVWFNYESTICGGESTEQTVKVSANDLLSSNYKLDYSLFTVNDFSTIEPFGYLGLETREAFLGEDIYIPQHGGGDPKQLSIESDLNPGGLCEIDADNLDGRGTGTDVGYYCDSKGGGSGAPVLSSESNKAIALNHSIAGNCMNTGVKMSEIWPKVSRHFRRVVPDGDGGIPPNNNTPTANYSLVCTNLNCSFNGSGSTDSDGQIESYSWDFGDAQTAVGASAVHEYATAGTYGVALTVTDDGGATDTKIRQVEVNTDPAPEPQIELQATSAKRKGSKWANLSWTGSESGLIEIYRDSVLIDVVANEAAYQDNDIAKSVKSARYMICEPDQSSCSNTVEVRF